MTRDVIGRATKREKYLFYFTLFCTINKFLSDQHHKRTEATFFKPNVITFLSPIHYEAISNL